VIWIMLVYVAIHLLMPVAWIAVYFAIRNEPRWIMVTSLVPLWLVFTFVDAVTFGLGPLGSGALIYAGNLLRTGIPIVLALAVTQVLRTKGISARWQRTGGAATGVIAALLQPLTLIYLGCGFAGECL
jgi:hypothetical protein